MIAAGGKETSEQTEHTEKLRLFLFNCSSVVKKGSSGNVVKFR